MKIRYFGVLSEVTGKSEENLEFSGLVRELIEHLSVKYPDLTKYDFQVAVNQEISNQEENLEEAHEIALLPPFAGG